MIFQEPLAGKANQRTSRPLMLSQLTLSALNHGRPENARKFDSALTEIGRFERSSFMPAAK